MTNEVYVENIESTTNTIVEEKETNYNNAVENTNVEKQEELVQIETVEQEVVNIEEGITQNEMSIADTDRFIEEVVVKADANQTAIESAIDYTYDKMGISDDNSYDWGDNHTYDEKKDVYENGVKQFEDAEIELTATCDKAKEDYTTLKNAVEQYGKDYDEEAYNKAIEGITIPVINIEETNQASEALIAKLEEYDDTAEWITSIRDYQKSVEELNVLNLEAMFNDLYATKDKYDELKSMKEELEAKKEELANKQAELDQMYEALKANDAIRAEEIAQAKAELDKAIVVQQNVLAGIYEKVDDPAYAKYNEAIDAYLANKEEEEQKPAEEEQVPKEEEQTVVVPKSDEGEILKELVTEKPVYQEVQKVTEEVPTATYSGLTGYAVSAVMAMVCLGACLKKQFSK